MWTLHNTMNEGQNSRTAKARILVVDDEMGVAMTMAFLLTRAGCESETALSAEKALRLAQTKAFDLITLDIDMPGSSGFDLIGHLRQIPHLKEIPVVFVSVTSPGNRSARLVLERQILLKSLLTRGISFPASFPSLKKPP